MGQANGSEGLISPVRSQETGGADGEGESMWAGAIALKTEGCDVTVAETQTTLHNR